MDEEDEGSKFCEEDIDQILQRRTQTITIESEGKGSTFAKVINCNIFISTYVTHYIDKTMPTYVLATYFIMLLYK